MTSFVRRCLIIALALALLSPSQAGWGFERETHADITVAGHDRSAISNALGELGIDRAQRLKGSPLQLSRLPVDWLVRGARDEDDTLSANFARYRNHFYDPVNNRGLTATAFAVIPIRGERAPDWALEDQEEFFTQAFSYRDARLAFLAALIAGAPADREAALASTIEILGHVIHPLQDMASPPHTRNDIHGGFGFGPASLFERYLDQAQVRRRLNFDGTPVRFGLPRQYWTTGDGRGLAEFVNRNFVSEGTNFTTRIEGAIAGGYPNPVLRLGADDQGRPFETTVDIQTQLEPGLRDRNGNLIDGSVTFFANNFQDPITGTALRNERMTTLSLFDRELERRGAALVFTLNRYNIEAQAAFLVPRAVGYSAGLLDYFFRGKLDYELAADVDPARAILVGFNRSAEALGLGGQLSLYWEDAAGRREPVDGPTLSLATEARKDDPLPSLTFTWPSDPERPPKRFVLAYQGPLGLEADAVIGKVVENPALEQIAEMVLFDETTRQYVILWFLRTADGVYVLPFADWQLGSIQGVRWGEKDNTLVVQAIRGDAAFTGMTFTVFEIARAEGVRAVPTTGEIRWGHPVVALRQLQSVPLTAVDGLDLGTTVDLSHRHILRQFLLSLTVTNVSLWNEASRAYVYDSTEVSDPNLELPTTFDETYRQTFRLLLDRDHFPETCGFDSPCTHYEWSWGDFALTAAGDVLLLVTLGEGVLPFAGANRGVPELGRIGTESDIGPTGGNFSVSFGFPQDSPFVNDWQKMRFMAWVNLSQRTVLAKTMSDHVTLGHVTLESALHEWWQDINETRGGPNDRKNKFPWRKVFCAIDPAPFTAQLEQGLQSLTYTGLYGPGFADLNLETDFTMTQSTEVTSVCGGPRITSKLGTFPYRITNARVVLPGTQALERFPLVFTRRSEEGSQLVLWDGLKGTAQRLFQVAAPAVLQGATANQRWVLVDGYPQAHLVALDGSGILSFPWEDDFGRQFTDMFTLLAPDRVYNALDDTFYTVVGQELKPTKFRPDQLAPAPANAPYWPFHLVRPR